ncbi:MAG: 4Fe-4S binding protein [Candidatus Cloacimonetes bacterium]|nr:4Fe-4S binding protein [Candidatus Cloacimonadota bacterium]
MKKIIYSLLAIFMLVTLLYGVSRLVYQINPAACTGCGHCFNICAENAINYDETVDALQIDTELCTGCGACLNVCPYGAFYDDDSMGVIYGCVTSSVTGFPISNASVQAGDHLSITGMFGMYSFFIPAGEYDITCSMEDFADSTVTDVILEGQHSCLRNFVLNPDVAADAQEINEIMLSCYPNPVRSGTSVRFSCAGEDIEIYNFKGQFVKRVRNEWDLNDYDGKSVTAGVYFYRVKDKARKEFSKIVVK